MKKLRTQEVLLIVLPCAILAALAVFLQSSPHTGYKQLHQTFFPKFALVVDEVQFTRVPASFAGHEAYKFYIYINHQGPRPSWWNTGTAGANLLNPHFVNKKGEKYAWNIYSISYWNFDKLSQRYFIEGETEVAKDFGASESILVSAVSMGNKAGRVRFEVPVKEGSNKPIPR